MSRRATDVVIPEADLARFAEDCIRKRGAAATSSPIQLRLAEHSVRPGAAVLRYSVDPPGAGADVFVKASYEPACRSKDGDRDVSPGRLLSPRVIGSARSRMEYAALRSIEEHFTGLGDPRFGAVRVLGLMEGGSAVCVERCPHPTLRAASARRGRAAIAPAFKNAGAWLKEYHGMETPGHCAERHIQRDDFLRHVQAQSDYLGRSLGDQAFFTEVMTRMRQAAGDVLPRTLPTGVGHGDFAPRNVMAAPDGRVFVIDTLARWQTCIYEDLSSFIFAVVCSDWRSLVVPYRPSQGTSRQNHLQKEFLSGYFGDEPIPYTALHLYHVQAVLNKWAAVLASPEWPGRRRKHVRPAALLGLSYLFRQSVRRALRLTSTKGTPIPSATRSHVQ
jgi:hypothetical protein